MCWSSGTETRAWATPLGFGEVPAAKLDEHRVQVAAGALLVLYTASVSPTQAHPDAGPNRSVIATLAQLDPRDRPASALLDALRGAHGWPNDIAVITALFR